MEVPQSNCARVEHPCRIKYTLVTIHCVGAAQDHCVDDRAFFRREGDDTGAFHKLRFRDMHGAIVVKEVRSKVY
jgi:hypothetical protein